MERPILPVLNLSKHHRTDLFATNTWEYLVPMRVSKAEAAPLGMNHNGTYCVPKVQPHRHQRLNIHISCFNQHVRVLDL